MMKRLIAAAFILGLSCLSAAAQSCWPDPNQTRANCGSPVMYVNASNQAVPVTAAAPLPISVTDGVGKFDTSAATVTRPADTTAYASGDLIANSVTAGSVTPMALTISRANDKGFAIFRVRLSKTNTSITNANFRAHFYRTIPTVTNGDNGVWLSTNSNYMGCFDITMDKVFSDAAKGVGVPCTGNQIIGVPTTGTQLIYSLLEARAAYTPASAEVFTLLTEQAED